MRNSSLQIKLIGSLMLIVATAVATAAQVMPYRVADRQVRDLIAQIERETNTFRADAQRAIDRSIWNGTRSEDSMDRLLNGFETATDNLRSNFSGRRSSAADVQTVLDRAAAVDRLMQSNNFPNNVENEWTQIRSDLDTLAGYYSVRYQWVNTGTGYGSGTGYGTGTGASTGWGNNRYTVTDRELQSTINRLRFRSSSFRSSYTRWSSRRGVWNNSQPNTTVTQAVNDLDTALNSYASGYAGTTGRDLDTILRAASTIDAFMRSTTTNTDLNSRWNLIRTDVNTLTGYYGMNNWDWQTPRWDTTAGANTGWNGGGRGNRGGFDAMLTGTYRLNTSRSDNVVDVIARSVTTTDTTGRDRQRRMLERRLQSPDMIVVEKIGNQIDIASSSAQRIQLDTSGARQTETTPNGRTMTTSVNITGREMTINYEGDRMNDFFVSFTPMGRGLQVTRRVYLENTNQQVTVNSFYDKTDDTARWDSITYTNNNASSGNNGGYPGYYGNYPTDVWGVANNSTLVARLDTPLSTRTLRDGDTFQMTVTSPGEYSGAIIRGTAYGNRSGSVSGRANMSFNFDSIQLRNGQTYRFAGIVDGVRTPNGDTVSVNNEGLVRDSSQTNKTVTRAGIGAALGALIGAIAGGGSGAAIGATVGAGAGAGSIVLQGRDNLELTTGTEFRITATAPSRVGTP